MLRDKKVSFASSAVGNSGARSKIQHFIFPFYCNKWPRNHWAVIFLNQAPLREFYLISKSQFQENSFYFVSKIWTQFQFGAIFDLILQLSFVLNFSFPAAVVSWKHIFKA